VTKVERALLKAFDRYYGSNGMAGDFDDELRHIAEAVGKAHSKNAKALKSLAETEELRWAMAEVYAGRKSDRLQRFMDKVKP